jgi:hypothetical protein
MGVFTIENDFKAIEGSDQNLNPDCSMRTNNPSFPKDSEA